jgi:hypothetical protein
VLAATQAYREGMDVLAGFLSEHCLQENEVEVEVGLLYAKYVQWAEGAGVRRLARNVFGTQMHGQLYANPNMCPLLWSTTLHRRHSSHPSHSRLSGTSIHQEWNDRHHGLIHADKNA